MQEFYSIRQLAECTGLSDRTIRNYLASGILEGEKGDGVWRFTPEQMEQFVRHPAVRPSILAKNHGAVYDFLSTHHTEKSEICLILDLPGQDREVVSRYFCKKITQGQYANIRFTFDGVSKAPRVILSGDTQSVLGILQGMEKPPIQGGSGK